MKAIVLTCDRYRAVTEHMILQYEKLWPDHPFVFRVPYQKLQGAPGNRAEYVQRLAPDLDPSIPQSKGAAVFVFADAGAHRLSQVHGYTQGPSAEAARASIVRYQGKLRRFRREYAQGHDQPELLREYQKNGDRA